MEQVRRYFKRDEVARELGIELIEVDPGRAVCRMAIEKRHTNSLRIAHGGTMFSLADFAFAVACNTGEQVSVAAQASITFLKAVPIGATLTAVAEEAGPGKKLASYNITIVDDAGDKVALFQGLAYRKRETMAETLKSWEEQGCSLD